VQAFFDRRQVSIVFGRRISSQTPVRFHTKISNKEVEPAIQLTSEGRRLAVFITKTYTRIVDPSLAELNPALPADIGQRIPLAQAWRTFEQALQARINQARTTPSKMTCS